MGKAPDSGGMGLYIPGQSDTDNYKSVIVL